MSKKKKVIWSYVLVILELTDRFFVEECPSNGLGFRYKVDLLFMQSKKEGKIVSGSTICIAFHYIFYLFKHILFYTPFGWGDEGRDLLQFLATWMPALDWSAHDLQRS